MKSCKDCGCDDLSKFRKGLGVCRKCESKRNLKNYYKNRRRAIESNNKWRAANPDKVKKHLATYFQNHKQQGTERSKKNFKIQRVKLADCYVKKILGIKGKVPKELIEVKRLQIQLIRMIKNEKIPASKQNR